MSVDVVEQFASHLATLTDESDRRRAISRATMLAMREAPEEAFRPVGRSASDLLSETPVEPDWLIPGVMARGWMIKFAAREKTGKGTLIAHLLGKLERGRATVFGDSARASALIYTEEPAESIREKIEQAGLSAAWIVYGWELASCTTWEAKVDRLPTIAGEGDHDIVFVDNVSRAAGIEDEAGVELARAAEYLGEQAKALGISVVIDHHHKGGCGQAR